MPSPVNVNVPLPSYDQFTLTYLIPSLISISSYSKPDEGELPFVLAEALIRFILNTLESVKIINSIDILLFNFVITHYLPT